MASTPDPTLRTCAKGHSFHKSSSCPTCPVCEAARKPSDGLLARLSAPARRAFERAGIASAEQISQRTKAEILALHGVGPGTIPVLQKVLADAGLKFRV